MNESARKLLGLAMMIVSVFVILFASGADELGAPHWAGTAVPLFGWTLLLVGALLLAIAKKR